MKKFSFHLGRVMDWRQVQVRIEESKLERLYAEMRGIDGRVAELNEERAVSERALITAASSTGFEMAALGAFQRFSIVEQARLAAKRADCTSRITAQTQVVVSRRRDVRLIEKLKERRLEAWLADFAREIDAQAEEAYLSRWNRAGTVATKAD